MRVLFWGTPAFAVPSLEALLYSPHELVGVVTQPDRPRGRSGRIEPPAVKERLARSGSAVPVLQPEKPSGAAFRETLAALEPDLSVVAAYGNLLPGRVLELPRLGSLNVHASLLPRHRGAAPVAAAILAGDAETGITLMRMDRGLDTGPILLQRSLTVDPAESCGELTSRLAVLGADVLLQGLALAEVGGLVGTPQRAEDATYAPRQAVEDARIDWSERAASIERRLRAYDPWPGAFTTSAGRRLKIFRGRVLSPDAGLSHGVPGEVLASGGGDLVVSTGEGALEILELQLEGRPRMAASEFQRGRPLAPGSRLA